MMYVLTDKVSSSVYFSMQTPRWKQKLLSYVEVETHFCLSMHGGMESGINGGMESVMVHVFDEQRLGMDKIFLNIEQD